MPCARPRNRLATIFLTTVGDIDGDNEGVEVGALMVFNMKNIDEVLEYKLSLHEELVSGRAYRCRPLSRRRRWFRGGLVCWTCSWPLRGLQRRLFGRVGSWSACWSLCSAMCIILS